MANPGEKSGFLSLTGRLSLQEKKDRKDRKGRITFRKKISLWFWFDEKECCLKYYKNSTNYLSHLHNYEGTIDLRNAKVSPSEVYLDGKGTTSIDQDIVSNRTFLIFTSTDRVFALTAETDAECHRWIKKLQEKRAQWEKKEQVKTRTPQKEEVIRSFSSQGLVCESASRSPSSRSHVHKIFQDYLGYDELVSSAYGTSYPPTQPSPIPSPPITKHPSTTNSFPEEALPPSFTISPSTTNGPEGIEGSGELHNFETQPSNEEGLESSPLTEQEREILRLKVELSESHQEKEKLQQKVAFLEDEGHKHYLLKMQLLNEIQELTETVHKLKASVNSPTQEMQHENENLKDIIKKLQRSLRSLDGEVELSKAQLNERNKRLQEAAKKQREMEDSLFYIKAKYVSLLDYSFKIPTPSPSGIGVEELDPMEEKLKRNLLDLIQEESSTDTSLVDISGDLSVFEDLYGEFHDWKNDSNICHFLCRQLYLHYTEYEQESLTQELYNYVKQLKVTKEGHWEIPPSTSRSKRRELRAFLRKGIPQPMRSNMWTSLIFSHVGRIREVKNSTTTGGNYYKSLQEVKSQFQKQILLDKYRTMPSNKHFKMDQLGAKKLERVLVAYSNHNRNVGYCQGMNMIAAVGLLFLDEETTFWYLVAIIEKTMPQHYFTNGLAAAQADQVIMKELVAEKLPILSEHLELNGIDVTVVTFNWFLTIFIDALPTESMLRVMDCFLLEGRKILFRLSLAIFKLHESRILSMNDPVSIFQFVKEVAKHIFNVEELFRIAFKELEPFPSRSTIQSRRQPHLDSYLAEWKKREALKVVSQPTPTSPPPTVSSINVLPPQKQRKHLQWECGASVSPEEVWLCCGERQTGLVCIVQANSQEFDIKSPGIDVGSKILCIKAFSNGIVMVGTLDFSIHAICIKSRKELWSMKMSDSVLDFEWYQDNLICALADGYIASVSPAGRSPPSVDPTLYRIGSIAVQCMVLTPHDHVWVGCGKNITVLEAQSQEPVKAIVIPDKAGKAYRMERSKHGIWLTFKTSSLLYLYDCEHMVPILTVDYLSLLPNTVDTIPNIDTRITVMTTFEDVLWIGTGNATFHLFKLSSSVAKPNEQIKQIVRSSKRVTDSMKDAWKQRRDSDDEGLIGGRGRSLTPPPDKFQVESDKQIKQEQSLPSDGGGYRWTRKRSFGRTFRMHKRKESHDQKDEAVYKLEHMWSCEAPYEGRECLKVTTVKPISKNGQRFVISCVNSTSMFPKAVQLWQCNTESPLNMWNYTCLSECHEVMSREISKQPLKRASARERGRAYSTILGSLSPTQTLPPISDLSFTLVNEFKET